MSREPPVTAIERKETAVLAFEKDSAVGEIIWDTYVDAGLDMKED